MMKKTEKEKLLWRIPQVIEIDVEKYEKAIAANARSGGGVGGGNGGPKYIGKYCV